MMAHRIRFEDKIHLEVFSTENNVSLKLYKDDRDIFGEKIDMIRDGTVFKTQLPLECKGMQYTFLVGENEVSDPACVACSINSHRSVLLDLRDTDPEGFREHSKPPAPESAVIYEAHVKDYTYFTGAVYNGKFLGMAERELTVCGQPVGIDNLVELGITHLHLMPVNDFLTVDENPEAFYDENNYNWGYDPEHYNVPEGSYATDAKDPAARIKELKTLIMALHRVGIRVVLDVVYNHTYRGLESSMNVLAPFYYHRSKMGVLSSGSGCGNEIASERQEVRAFIVDSLRFWMTEYMIDGFRFDLWGLMDTETAELAVEVIRSVDEDALIYGEPWVGGPSALPESMRVRKGTQRGKRYALFNDEFRDSVKGDNNGYGNGYVQGNTDLKTKVETGFLGSVNYDERHRGFCLNAHESINYVNSHDDLNLRDKLFKTAEGKDISKVMNQYKLSLALNILSLGHAFINEGNEFFRTKYGTANTYNSSIKINGIDWKLKAKHIELFNFTKKLIEIKKSIAELNLGKEEEIRSRIRIIDGLKESQLGFELRGEKTHRIYFFSDEKDLPEIKGQLLLDDDVVRVERLK